LAPPVAYLIEATIEGGKTLTNFLALYRGDTIASSKILAITADPHIVQDFAAQMLDRPPNLDEDPALASVENGRRKALRVVAGKKTESPAAGQSKRGESDGIQDKEHSAYGCIIPD